MTFIIFIRRGFKERQSLDSQIYLQQLTIILTRLIVKLANQEVKTNPKNRLSGTYTLEYLIKGIYILFYQPKKYLTTFQRLLRHIAIYCLTYLQSDRSFPRISYINKSKWYYVRKGHT